MNPKEELMSANADVMTIIAHARKIGWETISYNSLQRVVYMMKVLYSFCHDEANPFGLYHFNVSLYFIMGRATVKITIFPAKVNLSDKLFSPKSSIIPAENSIM